MGRGTRTTLTTKQFRPQNYTILKNGGVVDNAIYMKCCSNHVIMNCDDFPMFTPLLGCIRQHHKVHIFINERNIMHEMYYNERKNLLTTYISSAYHNTSTTKINVHIPCNLSETDDALISDFISRLNKLDCIRIIKSNKPVRFRFIEVFGRRTRSDDFLEVWYDDYNQIYKAKTCRPEEQR